MKKESTEPTVLDTLTTDELWEELRLRYDACVLIYEKDEKGEKDDCDCTYDVNWKGSKPHIKGLIEFGRVVIDKYIENLFECEETIDD